MAAVTAIDERLAEMTEDDKRTARAISEAEKARRAAQAREALNSFESGVRGLYRVAPPRVREFLEKGSWKTAASEFERAGMRDEAGALRLATPYLFEH